MRGMPLLLGRYRKAAGLTQAELARRVGISVGHLSRIENGQVIWSEGLERQICHALELSDHERIRAFGLPGWSPSNDERKGGRPRGPRRPGHLRVLQSTTR